MRIQFYHNATEEAIAEFDVKEVPTKEECEAIENEIYEAMDKWEEEHGDFEDFDFWKVCYDTTIKHLHLVRNPVVKTFYI